MNSVRSVENLLPGMKKLWIAIGTGIIAGGIGTGIYFGSALFTKKQSLPQYGVPQAVDVKANLTWNDPAGFTFQYPDGLTIDKHDEDKENYAHIEMTHKDHPGNIIIWAKDTNASDVTAWVRTEKRFKDASILDTTLGEKPAKKILLATPSSTLIVGAIDDEILFTIEASLDEEGFWSKIHDEITESFAFIPIASDKKSNSSSENVGSEQPRGVEEEPFDEEEVIE